MITHPNLWTWPKTLLKIILLQEFLQKWNVNQRNRFLNRKRLLKKLKAVRNQLKNQLAKKKKYALHLKRKRNQNPRKNKKNPNQNLNQRNNKKILFLNG